MSTHTGPLSVLQVLEKNAFTTGSVVQMFELARGLARRGHRVAVVSRPGGEIESRCAAEGLALDAMPLKHEFDLGSARRLARLYEVRGVQVVHAHKGIAHSVALLATAFSKRRPVLVVNRGVSFPLDAWNRWKYHVRLGGVVTVCEDIRRVIVATGRIAPEKVHVVYAGVDTAVFDPARTDGRAVRREWDIAEDETLAVQVGAREWKGWRDFLEGVAGLAGEFPKLKGAVVACADEAQKALVADAARKLGIQDRVVAAGFRSDMPDVLAAADFVADMSYEGLGITGTLREAMALGKPVVASAAGGNPELVVDAESGLLVRPRDPASLTRALRRLLTDPAEASRLARAGRERVIRGFTLEVRLDRIEALYRRLLEKGAGS